MIAGKKSYDMFSFIFNLRLWLRPMAKGRSFSEPNIRLRPKMKIAPTVQHWLCTQLTMVLFIYLDRMIYDFFILQIVCNVLNKSKNILVSNKAIHLLINKRHLGTDDLALKPFLEQTIWPWNHTSHKKISFMNLLPMSCVITSIEAVRGQTPYSERTLWHFNSTFVPSHSAGFAYQKK